MKYLHMGEGRVRPHVSELVINWHFTEACNYKCRYCYAKWDGDERELLYDWGRTRRLLDELTSFFDPANAANPLRESLSWSAIRLNLAGGEPLLYPKATLRVLALARSVGMNTSIITNGSRLTSELVTQLSPLVSMIGVSVDSANAATNRMIGRVDGRGVLPDEHELADLLAQARGINPELQIKLNTVVNALNADEDLGKMLAAFTPDRWKVFRMLPVVTGDLAVSSEAFEAFVARHERYKGVMCVEDNSEMSESYLMIDPLGRFFQNTRGQQGYSYSRAIDLVGAGQAFRDWRFSVGSYASRYRNLSIGAET
jgi:radical S-adenosyl methionine domain-containing protein 2